MTANPERIFAMLSKTEHARFRSVSLFELQSAVQRFQLRLTTTLHIHFYMYVRAGEYPIQTKIREVFHYSKTQSTRRPVALVNH